MRGRTRGRSYAAARSRRSWGALHIAVTVALSAFLLTAAGAGAQTYNSLRATPFIEGGPPSITSISPKYGRPTATVQVTINGANFTGATKVQFGGLPAESYEVVSDGKIMAWSPAGHTGAMPVSVTTPSGTSEETPGDVFTEDNLPHVEAVLPSIGPEGVEGLNVEIKGAGFEGLSSVKFGSVTITKFSFVSNQVIDLQAPAGTGTVDIRVKTTEGTSAIVPEDTFGYVQPNNTSVTPSVGREQGGTMVKIEGTNLDGATAVLIGGMEATDVIVESAHSITAVTPPGTGFGQINVITPHGQSFESPGLYFSYVGPPTVSGNEVLEPRPTSVTVRSGTNSHGLPLTTCEYEYGKTEAYEASVPCSNLASGTTLSGLTPSTQYHARIVAGDEAGTTFGTDFTLTTLDRPQFGRCLKGGHANEFSNAGCSVSGGTRTYEWAQAVGGRAPLVKPGFAVSGHALKVATAARQALTCTGVSGSGAYTASTKLGGLSMTFTGCALEGLGACQSSGAAAGEVRSDALEGLLGVVTANAEPAKDALGIALVPASGDELAAFTCGSTPVSLHGGAIGATKAGKMSPKNSLKIKSSKGVQSITQLEGGKALPLELDIGAAPPQAATASLSLTLVNQEKVEINPVL